MANIQPQIQTQPAAHAEQEDHPLFAARPPATDPITYLTIVEYNISEDNLPVLHQVLQDSELTATIGWDLIHLLLPLLPASEECLQDIASRGNPKECVLKVTEALRLLEFEEREESDDEKEADEDGADASDQGAQVSSVQVSKSSTNSRLPSTVLPPLSVLKFEVLLDILATLHRRVKTKYPSRFLSTSLQAALYAFNRANTHIEELTLSAVKFVKTISGTKRPHLPSRRSSGNLLRTTSGTALPNFETKSDVPSDEEKVLVNRLLQSFITHILEDYILSLTSVDDVPGLAWSSRLMEKYEPQRIPDKPNYQRYSDRFASDEDLTSRSAILGQIVALAQDLGLQTENLLSTVLDAETEKRGVPGIEDDPPSSAQDIPLSRAGALILLTARLVKTELFAPATPDPALSLPTFPTHATLLKNFIGTLGPPTAGLEPEALLDTILALALIALQYNNIGEPADDEAFAEYLQAVSLVAANAPSPSLRGHAHYVVASVLRSHPHDLVRLTFIRDTLEYCPYENLRASAVGWVKGETVEANAEVLRVLHGHGHESAAVPRYETDGGTKVKEEGEDEEEREQNIFATPVALSTLAPFLWPNTSTAFTPTTDLPLGEAFTQFRASAPYHIAALNFLYLLLSAQHLHEPLNIKALYKESHIREGYLEPLRSAVKRFDGQMEKEGMGELRLEEEEKEAARAEVKLVGRVVEWVEDVGGKL